MLCLREWWEQTSPAAVAAVHRPPLNCSPTKTRHLEPDPLAAKVGVRCVLRPGAGKGHVLNRVEAGAVHDDTDVCVLKGHVLDLNFGMVGCLVGWISRLVVKKCVCAGSLANLNWGRESRPKAASRELEPSSSVTLRSPSCGPCGTCTARCSRPPGSLRRRRGCRGTWGGRLRLVAVGWLVGCGDCLVAVQQERRRASACCVVL